MQGIQHEDRNSMEDMSGRFETEAVYVADASGCIDCSKQSAVGGRFKGVEPMGLFWSLDQSPGQRKGTRLMKKDIDVPSVHKLSLFDKRRELSIQRVERHFVSPATERIEVRHGRVRGALYQPKDHSLRCPAVIDLFGTAGGLLEHRAALLAAKGFVVLALPYFGYADLPKGTQGGLDMEYFMEAIDYMESLPNASAASHGIGMIGVSLGADIAYLMSTLTDKISVAIGINGVYQDFMQMPEMRFEGKELFQRPSGDPSLLKPNAEGIVDLGAWCRSMPFELERNFPVESSRARFLTIVGLDDLACPPEMSEVCYDRMTKFGGGGQLHDRMEMLRLEGTGHLIEPPYQPVKSLSFHKYINSLLTWGGAQGSAHNHGQEIAWKRMIEFLTENLGEPAKISDEIAH